MKKTKNMGKKRIFIVFSFVALLLCATLLIVYFATNTRDYNIYNVKVNGVVAQKNSDGIFVQINQSKYVNITYELRDGKSKVFCYSDSEFTQENTDLKNVYIGGIDTQLHLVVKEGNQIKKTETVNITNAVPQDEEFAFTIQGFSPKKTENGYKIFLPHGTNKIDLSGITIGSNFSYVLYFDEARKNAVEELKNIPINSEQTQFFVDIKNVNVTDVVKSFTVTVEIEKSNANSVLGLTANGIEAEVSNQEITVQINKCKNIDLKLQISQNATFKMFIDEQKTVEIPDIANVDVTNYLKSATFYANVTAQNGEEKLSKIQIEFILDNNVDIEYLIINGVKGQKSGNEIVVLLNRTTSLELESKTVSADAACEFYYDRALTNKILEEKNIDIHAFEEAVLQFFCVVIAQDNTTKVFSVTVNFILSPNCELFSVSINNYVPEFVNGFAELVFEGVIETFTCNFQQIKVSRAATTAVFLDKQCTNRLIDLDEIKLASSMQSFFIQVTAENLVTNAVYEVKITLISNDNALKSITINGQEHIINSDTVNISIDTSDQITINTIKHDDKAEVSLFYDILQTEPVLDRNNVLYLNRHTELYLRVIAENLSVKVYKCNIDIKIAPEVVFGNNSIQLQEWQTKIKIADLFTVKNNNYPNGRFDVEVICDSIKQNTEFLNVKNENRFLDVQVKITSPYFIAFYATKSIQILPYELRPIEATINVILLETKEETVTFMLKELVDIRDGSYTIGKDYYVEIYAANNQVQVAVDKNAVITLKNGVYKIYISAFRNLFNSIKVGETTVKVLEKRKPVIISPDYLEYEVSSRQINIAELFIIENNDEEILLTKTFANGIEQEFLTCESGMYNIKLQIFYNGGMIEKSLLIEIATLSDNTLADIFINDKKIDFASNPVILPDLNYFEDLRLNVCNFNSNATVKAYVNGILVSLGDLNLACGINEIRIVVTAQSGRVQEYSLTVIKKERLLPIIETTDKTIKLEKNQSYIMLSNYFTVTQNDYNTLIKLYYNGNEIYGNCLQVENTDKIYNIEIRLSGEFGTISEFLHIGVIAFNSVEITYNTTTISAKADYIFSEKDFLNDVTFYGINGALCTTVMYINGEKFVPHILTAGMYQITVQVWQSGLLLKEDSAWFTLNHTQEVSPVTVVQLMREVDINQKTVNADYKQFFSIQYGNYDPSAVNITYVYNDLDAAQSHFVLAAGNNTIILILTDRKSGGEIFRGKFVIKCNYVANSDSVFAEVKANNKKVKLNNNNLLLLSNTPLQTLNLSTIPNTGMTVYGLLSTYNLQPGLNVINYFVQEGIYTYNGTLNVYNLCTFSYYLLGISYNGIVVENNTLLLNEGMSFQINNLLINYNEFSHITIQKDTSKFSDSIFDVTITASYDGFAIGSVIFRVFIGKQMPSLTQIVAVVRGDAVVYYGINEFSLEVIAVTDTNSVGIKLVFSEVKYSAIIEFKNLIVGENICSFSVWESNTMEYIYSAKVTVLPQAIINLFSYDGIVLQKSNNQYVLGTEIDLSKISYTFTDSITSLDFAVNSQAVYFNGNIVGYHFEVLYKFVCVEKFSVVLQNVNTSVNVVHGGTALVQSGSILFQDNVEIEKSLTADSIFLQYLIKPIYPFATVEGNGITNEELGFVLTIDLSEISLYEAGTYTLNYAFTVFGVSAKTEYTLTLTVTVTDI